jgi:hypothetical protein
MSGDEIETYFEGVEVTSPAPGVIVTNHAASKCDGHPCPVHSPTAHHMVEWPYRFEQGIQAVIPWSGKVFVLTTRQCPHEMPHPDPDSLDYARWLAGHDFAMLFSEHECDGCCLAPVTEPTA